MGRVEGCGWEGGVGEEGWGRGRGKVGDMVLTLRRSRMRERGTATMVKGIVGAIDILVVRGSSSMPL